MSNKNLKVENRHIQDFYITDMVAVSMRREILQTLNMVLRESASDEMRDINAVIVVDDQKDKLIVKILLTTFYIPFDEPNLEAYNKWVGEMLYTMYLCNHITAEDKFAFQMHAERFGWEDRRLFLNETDFLRGLNGSVVVNKVEYHDSQMRMLGDRTRRALVDEIGRRELPVP